MTSYSSKVKICFVVTSEFLRSRLKTNPFIDLIIGVCDENHIPYRFLMPKGVQSGYDPCLIDTTPILFPIAVWFWRGLCLFWRVEPYRIYALFARLVRPFLPLALKADVFIGSGSPYAEILTPMAHRSRVIDVQHGVIYSKHGGYFNVDRTVTNFLVAFPNREIWVFGKGYADCFFKNPVNGRWLGKQGTPNCRVKVIGDVVGHSALPLQEGRKILAFSAQLTGDFTAEVSAEMVRRMRRFFEETYAKYGSRLRYLLKQHPRFNHCDIEPLKALPYLEFTDAPWSELYPQMLVHVTFSSTVCFDCASCGIPTRFEPYPENNILDSRYYQDDYSYPYLDWSLEQILEEQTRDPDTLHRTIRAWYETCYTPFSKENCLKLLKGEV